MAHHNQGVDIACYSNYAHKGQDGPDGAGGYDVLQRADREGLTPCVVGRNIRVASELAASFCVCGHSNGGGDSVIHSHKGSSFTCLEQSAAGNI